MNAHPIQSKQTEMGCLCWGVCVFMKRVLISFMWGVANDKLDATSDVTHFYVLCCWLYCLFVWGYDIESVIAVFKIANTSSQIKRTKAESQQIVAQRLLSCLQYLVPYLSRLQKIYLDQHVELCFWWRGFWLRCPNCMMLTVNCYRYARNIGQGEYRRFPAWILT